MPASFLGIMMMSGMFSGSGVVGAMGLPPGPKDTKLVNTAPKNAVLYLEWSERAGGKKGGKGIDGLAADPEVRQFINDVYKAITTMIDRETARGGDPEEIAMGKNIPPLVKILLNRPGCISVAVDAKDLKAGGGGFPPWFGLITAAKVTVVINGGKHVDTIAKHVKELLPAELRGKKLEKLPFPIPGGLPGMQVILHRHKEYFIIGFGKGTIDQAIAGLDGKSKGLAENTGFSDAAKRVSFERPANMVWINAKEIRGTVKTVLGAEIEKMIKVLGLDSTDVITTATGVIDGEIRTKSYLGTGGKTTGVLSLFSGRALKPADFAHVPADSDLVVAFSVNATKVLASAREIIGAIDPGTKADFEQLIKQFETELGLKLEKDLLAAFGDAWVIHNSKSAGGIFLTSVVASVEVRDHKKANDVVTKLMDVIEETLPGIGDGRFRRRGVVLKRKQFLGQTIYYINSVGQWMPFAPAFCLTKTHLLAAPHPQALKSHLRFLKSKEKNFGDRLGNDLKLPKGDLISVTYFESKRLVRMVYAFAPYFGQIIMSQIQSEGGEIDIFSLPSARAVLPYIGNTFSTTVRTEKGIYSEAKTGAPGAGGAVIMVVPMMIFWTGSNRGFRPRIDEKKAARRPASCARFWPEEPADRRIAAIPVASCHIGTPREAAGVFTIEIAKANFKRHDPDDDRRMSE